MAGAWQIVQDITVSGSAVTSVSFTGLTISKDDYYMLVSEFNFAQDNSVNITINGNTTLTNYYSQLIQASSSTIVGERGNYPRITASVAVSTKNQVITKIKLTNSGYFVYQADNIRMVGGTTPYIQSIYGTSTFTSTSITSITLTHSVASGIGIGSRFQLYKCVAEKVADITVATATTSVSITGLNIDKTGEYMLVSDVYNTSGSNTWYSLCVNGTTTETSYYRQEVTVSGTGISSERSNASYILRHDNGSRALNMTKIKLTNSGYFVSQTYTNRWYGSSTNLISKNYTTSTFTATSITSLTVKTDVANAIGIGSRFQLYKLK